MGSVYQLNAAFYFYLHHFLFRMTSLIAIEWNISKKNCIDFCFPNTVCQRSKNWILIFLEKNVLHKVSDDFHILNVKVLNVCFCKEV